MLKRRGNMINGCNMPALHWQHKLPKANSTPRTPATYLCNSALISLLHHQTPVPSQCPSMCKCVGTLETNKCELRCPPVPWAAGLKGASFRPTHGSKFQLNSGKATFGGFKDVQISTGLECDVSNLLNFALVYEPLLTSATKPGRLPPLQIKSSVLLLH